MATGRIGVTPTLGTRWSKAPAGGTTSLSGLDDNSVALVYSVGYEQVYRNGVLLSRGNDYTATSGNSITLTDATIAGDIIEVFANELVPLTDAISKGQFTAKGALLSATAASTPGVLAVGTNGQYLTANSSTSTGLEWTTLSAGAYTELASGNLSGIGSFSATSISSTYRQLVVELRSPRNGNGRSTNIRINNNSNSVYTFVGTENLGWTQNYSQLDGSSLQSFFGSSNTNDQNYGYLLVNNPSSGAMKMGYWQEFRAGPSWRNGWFRINDTNAITSLSVTLSDSETWTGGTYGIYGVK